MPGVLAQFWPRFCGAFIDALVYFLAAIPFFVVAVAVFIAGGSLTDDNGAGGGLLILLGFVLFIGSGFVPVVLQARALSRSGQTIGCRAMAGGLSSSSACARSWLPHPLGCSAWRGGKAQPV
jgi:uncharacterized RDD family membrane protein YckC